MRWMGGGGGQRETGRGREMGKVAHVREKVGGGGGGEGKGAREREMGRVKEREREREIVHKN